jgi:DNA polymerase III subunit delta'
MYFKDIVGQEEIKARLLRSVKGNRVSHAQLFTGPEGSGKLATALAYARYLSCLNRGEEDACGHCRNCVKFDKLAHPDLHFVFPVASTKEKTGKVISRDFMEAWRKMIVESQGYCDLPTWYDAIGLENKQGIISAEDCNEIIKTLSLKSFEGDYKFMIIWMADKLFHSAAPKILKILEEPPGKTLFLLITGNENQLLSTIVSRTQILRFPRLPEQEIVSALQKRLGVSREIAEQSAAISEGSYLKARRQALTEEEGQDNFELFARFMRLCYQRADKYFEINQLVSELSSLGREKQKLFLSYGLRMSRLCLLMNHQKSELVFATQAEGEFLKKFYPFINERNAAMAVSELELAQKHIERNGNPRLVFSDLSLRFARLLRS